MAACSEQVAWRPAKARSLRRRGPQHVLSFEALASFLKRFSLRQFARPSTKASCQQKTRGCPTRLWHQMRDGQPSQERLQAHRTRPKPPPKDASRLPIRMPKHKTPQSHQLRHPFAAARPSPKGPPETSLKPGPSLRTPLPSRLLCPPPYSLSRNTAHARRQPPVTSDGRPAAPTTLKKSPGPRRAPAPRTGQPKGARRL